MGTTTRVGLVVTSLVASLVAGCGGEQTFNCDPACPDGYTCTAAGCVGGGTAVDAGVPVDLSGCAQACTGSTPRCAPNGLCVPCLVDGDCPVGNLCKSLGNTFACVPGCADDTRCPMGTRCCGGGCLDVTKDANNCGSCGNVCTNPHSRSICQNSMCVGSGCAAGWGDCNNDGVDGCETNLRNDVNNCTACGMKCDIANAISGCANSMDPPCYIAACRYGFDDCNGDEKDGCETNVTADARNCGACGTLCAAKPNAAVKCINSSCRLTGCNPGFFDCDGNPANGCEVTVASDARNCGACGNVCAQGLVCKNGGCTCGNCNIPNAKTKCVNLMCVFDGCAQGFADCNNNIADGCEVDLNSDANNCSQCGMVCPNNQRVCVAGVCSNVPVNPFFDSMPVQTGSTMRGAGDACGTLITANQAANVVAIAVSVNLAQQGNVRFVIWDHPGHNIVYVSPPKQFPAGSAWRQSDVFQTVTLQAGKQYDVGGISDVGATWNYDTKVDNQNGIVSGVSNPNYTNFNNPTMGGHAGADCGIQLF